MAKVMVRVVGQLCGTDDSDGLVVQTLCSECGAVGGEDDK